MTTVYTTSLASDMVHWGSMRRVLVVFNPVSGLTFLRPSRARIRAEIEKHDARVTWVETRKTVHDALWQAVRKPFDRVIVIGGDGTVREVAQLLLEANAKTPLAILAQGTGNMLASSLGIPLSPLARAVKFAMTAPAEELDVLMVNRSRVCLIGAGQGYDTLFIQGAPRWLKQRVGSLAYAWSFIRTFLPYIARRYTIVVDGERHQVIGKLVLAINVFSLVGVPIERSVSAHDGLIDVFVLNPRTVWEALATGLAFLVRRPRAHIPRLIALQGKRVSIRLRKGREVQIDGEIYRDKHLDIEILPKALRLVHAKPFDGPAVHA